MYGKGGMKMPEKGKKYPPGEKKQEEKESLLKRLQKRTVVSVVRG